MIKSYFLFFGFFFLAVLAAFVFLVFIGLFGELALKSSGLSGSLGEASGYYFVLSAPLGYIVFFLLRNRLNYGIITLILVGICLGVFYLMGPLFDGHKHYIILFITLINYLIFFYIALAIPNGIIQTRKQKEIMENEADFFD